MAGSEEFYTKYWAGGTKEWSPRDSPIGEDDERILSAVRVSDRVLDIGCGDGRVAQYLSSRGVSDYTGIDVSPKAIELCRARGIPCQLQDLKDPLPFTDNSFQCTTIFEVLEHLFDPESCTREIFRVLNPGGLLLGSVPNIAYLPNRLLLLLGLFNPGGGPETSLKATWRDPHIRFFTVRTLRACLEQIGFEPAVVTGQGFSLARLPIAYRAPDPVQSVLSFVSSPLRRLGRLHGGLFGARLYFTARKPS